MTLSFREEDRDKFDAVQDGTKSVETRAATPKYMGIKAGDKITFACGKDEFSKTVKSVSYFEDIPTLLKSFPQSSIMPGTSTLKEAEAIYHSFPGYKGKIAKYGLLAFELE